MENNCQGGDEEQFPVETLVESEIEEGGSLRLVVRCHTGLTSTTIYMLWTVWLVNSFGTSIQ